MYERLHPIAVVLQTQSQLLEMIVNESKALILYIYIIYIIIYLFKPFENMANSSNPVNQ